MKTSFVHSDTPSKIKIATFNVSMESRNYVENQNGALSADILKDHLSSGENQQIKNIAEIIQIIRPDILLLNEFDYIENPELGIEQFQKKYLSKSQNGAEPILYPHYFVAPVNTGVLSDQDLDGDGKLSLPSDAHGFGFYPGHYGMVLLSRYPIPREQSKTFQRFRWKDMPGALRPKFPNGKSYYSGAAWDAIRLSSKSHWDIVVNVGKPIHVLASHPTPPVFDGEENRNGMRNHDEIRFWRDYVSGDASRNAYIYDDNGVRGGLKKDTAFVILGDLNASPVEGDGIREGIASLLELDTVAKIDAPKSLGGKKNKDSQYSATHTAYWGMRADYVIPSQFGFKYIDSAVFWPTADDPHYRLVKDRQSSSDHRLVWVELVLER